MRPRPQIEQTFDDKYPRWESEKKKARGKWLDNTVNYQSRRSHANHTGQPPITLFTLQLHWSTTNHAGHRLITPVNHQSRRSTANHTDQPPITPIIS